jgi:hypothetical protein
VDLPVDPPTSTPLLHKKPDKPTNVATGKDIFVPHPRIEHAALNAPILRRKTRLIR